MTLPVPLTVRVSNPRTDRHITADLHDLSFRTVVPGGFASLQMALNRPLVREADDLDYYTRVYVYDTRNGATVWEGRLEDPGRSAGTGGEVWDVAAVGPSAYASDRTAPIIYLDTSLERWRRGSTSSPKTVNTLEDVSDNDPGLKCQFVIGASAATNDTCVWIYRALWESGQSLAKVFCISDNGATTADWENRIGTGVGTGAQTARRTEAWSTTPTAIYTALGDGTYPLTQGDNVATLRITRAGGAVTLGNAGDGWGLFETVYVLAMLYDKTGAAITSGYGTATAPVIAIDEVIGDLLGRLLDQYDGDNATIETSYELVDQMAYPDGVTPAKVLEDCMLFAPGFYWAAWESNTDNLHRFEWKAWPDTVRYEADAVDGYQSTGSASELFNAVSVRYRDRWGFIRTLTSTSTVGDLVDAGLTRQGFVDLGDDVASTANATEIASQFLDEHATPPNAGTLSIARPIFDRDRGMMVQPWEIRPGHLIRVRGIMANTNTLNATSRDGVTVFQVTAVDFDTTSATATLELDSSPLWSQGRALAGRPSTARTLAKLDSSRITRRR